MYFYICYLSGGTTDPYGASSGAFEDALGATFGIAPVVEGFDTVLSGASTCAGEPDTASVARFDVVTGASCGAVTEAGPGSPGAAAVGFDGLLPSLGVLIRSRSCDVSFDSIHTQEKLAAD